MKADYIDLDLALRLHFPIVVIESHDEMRVVELLKRAVADNLQLGELQLWSASSGLRTVGCFSSRPLRIEGHSGNPNGETSDSVDPEDLLRHIRKHLRNAVIVLPDFHPYLTNPIIVRLLKEIAQEHYVNDIVLVMVSHAINMPNELERLCTHVEISIPDAKAIQKTIDREDWRSGSKKTIRPQKWTSWQSKSWRRIYWV